jgi:plasmid maintenance system antidote protein VapI
LAIARNFWLNLQCQYDIAVVERDKGTDINRRVRPADAA